MAKLYKVEMYVLDVNEQYQDLDEIIDMAEMKLDAHFNPFNIQMTEIEWEDDIDINHFGCTVDTYRKYFDSK